MAGRYEGGVAVVPPDPAEEIARLAELGKIEYEQERGPAAKSLSMRASVLDSLVADKRKVQGADGDARQGRALELPEHKLWLQPIDGIQLLMDLIGQLQRYVVMSHCEAVAVALWIIHCHAHDSFAISPRLQISSPEKIASSSLRISIAFVVRPRPRRPKLGSRRSGSSGIRSALPSA